MTRVEGTIHIRFKGNPSNLDILEEEIRNWMKETPPEEIEQFVREVRAYG